MLQNNILRRKIAFDTVEDRQKAAKKIKGEAMQVRHRTPNREKKWSYASLIYFKCFFFFFKFPN